ncbi:hypothetical protein [Propionicimonas sp.]|uniref:hypothetical protein n=1 Tax=Propionicimonas sp. TaxID=1955623 RepID=UPI0039E405F8
MDTRIVGLLAGQGHIAVSEHPRLRWSLSQLKASGELLTPLPGIYLSPGFTTTDWLKAVSTWSSPHGVLHAGSAASIWLPELTSPVAQLAHPSLRSRRNVEVTRRRIPPGFVMELPGLRLAAPAYAAAELAATDDGRAACEAIRLRLADSDNLLIALVALQGTVGQEARRKAVLACRTNPWSYAELRLHRILIGAGITDWVANRPLRLGDRLLWPDVRFRRRRLILEFDGRTVHNQPSQFLIDRGHWNLFEAFGYHMLHFGWEHLDEPAELVGIVRQAYRRAADC